MDTDNVLLNIQIPRSARDEFRITAKIRGTTMSAMIYQFMLRSIREEKETNPTAFPDYVEPPKIVGESEFEQIVYETFDGKPVSPSQFRAIMQNLKDLLAVREISDEPPRGKVVARIEPGKKTEPNRADVQRMIDGSAINEIQKRVTPRKRKIR